MDQVRLLAEPITDCHKWIEATMADVTNVQANWRPPGIANPIGAVYGHVVLGADFGLNTILNGRPPFAVSEWAGKTGLSELPAAPGPWHEWVARLRTDLQPFRAFASAVYEAWRLCLEGLRDEDLGRNVDLSAFGMGQRTLAGYLAMQIEHFSCHCGEIACLKGLQGSVGYVAGTPKGIG